VAKPSDPYVSALLALPFCVAATSAGGAPARSPSAAALELIAATPAAARGKLLQPFTDEARSEWHYTPRNRVGISWRDMNGAQRGAAVALMGTALSDPGLNKVRAVMALEIALRELEGQNRVRDPENYAIAIFGDPAGRPGSHWGWRIEGHHLSLHFTLDGDHHVATLPQFMGANPAVVPRDFANGGPQRGARVLGKEEDLARRVMAALTGAQRASALIDTRPYGDIVTRNAAKLGPLAPAGVNLVDLAAPEQAALVELIAVFAEHLQPELAEARLARVRAGALASIRFAWAGSLEPSRPHYFRIQGATFLIELDNSGGNHIHSVWRDFDGDWGRDVLGDHYRHGHSHRHGP
jgi:hypothetical protein